MIDIHSHTLWHLDDGSPDLETSLGMCSCASLNGSDTLILTPHLMYWDSAEELFDRRDRKTEQLTEILENERIDLELLKGFEILCDDEIFNIKYFNPYTLCGSRYILIEFDFFKTTEDDVLSWCNYLKANSLVPVIAHPERYGFAINDISSLDRLSESGVLFQINCGSPVGMFGERESVIALKMLKCGYVDFIASDAHGLGRRNTNMASVINMYPPTVNKDDIITATETNPGKLIDDIKITVNRRDFLVNI